MVDILWWAFVAFALIQTGLYVVRRVRRGTQAANEVGTELLDAFKAEQTALRVDQDAEAEGTRMNSSAAEDARSAVVEERQ